MGFVKLGVRWAKRDRKYEIKKNLPPDKTYGVVVDVIIDEEVVMEPVPVTPPAEVTPLAVLSSFPFPEVVVTPEPDVTVLPVPVWLADWALLFEFPLLFDPHDEEILVVTRETNWFYFMFFQKYQTIWGLGPTQDFFWQP